MKEFSCPHSEPLPTIPVGKPTRQIDFVLTRLPDPWEPAGAEVLDEAIASDPPAPARGNRFAPAPSVILLPRQSASKHLQTKGLRQK
jgi:hypothetical protein